MDEDTKLVRRCQKGDAEALEALIVKYQRQVYAFILRMTDDAEEAKDLTQTAFMNMAKGMSDFRGDSSFKTWLYRIAANLSLNHKRNAGWFGDDLPEELPAGGEGALHEAIEKEKREVLGLALAELPPRQRAAVLLRVYGGLCLRDAARCMGCSEGGDKGPLQLRLTEAEGSIQGVWLWPERMRK